MNNETNGPRILLTSEVLAITRSCRATLYRWIKRGIFPAPRQFGSQRIGWLAAEVEEWVQTRQAGVKHRQPAQEEI